MKNVYLIGGPMGVGKTAVGQYLKHKLPNAVFLDGDWCWDANPCKVTEETKDMVMDNICYLMNNFMRCSVYDNIILAWVMHEQSIIDTILEAIDHSDFNVLVISLLATKETLKQRIMRDVEAGIRTVDVLERSIKRIPLYQNVDSVKVHTDGKSIAEISEEILGVLK